MLHSLLFKEVKCKNNLNVSKVPDFWLFISNQKINHANLVQNWCKNNTLFGQNFAYWWAKFVVYGMLFIELRLQWPSKAVRWTTPNLRCWIVHQTFTFIPVIWCGWKSIYLSTNLYASLWFWTKDPAEPRWLHRPLQYWFPMILGPKEVVFHDLVFYLSPPLGVGAQNIKVIKAKIWWFERNRK